MLFYYPKESKTKKAYRAVTPIRGRTFKQTQRYYKMRDDDKTQIKISKLSLPFGMGHKRTVRKKEVQNTQPKKQLVFKTQKKAIDEFKVKVEIPRFGMKEEKPVVVVEEKKPIVVEEKKIQPEAVVEEKEEEVQIFNFDLDEIKENDEEEVEEKKEHDVEELQLEEIVEHDEAKEAMTEEKKKTKSQKIRLYTENKIERLISEKIKELTKDDPAIKKLKPPPEQEGPVIEIQESGIDHAIWGGTLQWTLYTEDSPELKEKLKVKNFIAKVQQRLENPNYIQILVKADSKGVGRGVMIDCQGFLTPKYSKLINVYVKREERRKGHATRMFNYIFERADREGLWPVTLDVDDFNSKAIKLYTKLGFKTKRRLWQLYLMRWRYYNSNLNTFLEKKKEVFEEYSEALLRRNRRDFQNYNYLVSEISVIQNLHLWDNLYNHQVFKNLLRSEEFLTGKTIKNATKSSIDVNDSAGMYAIMYKNSSMIIGFIYITKYPHRLKGVRVCHITHLLVDERFKRSFKTIARDSLEQILLHVVGELKCVEIYAEVDEDEDNELLEWVREALVDKFCFRSDTGLVMVKEKNEAE